MDGVVIAAGATVDGYLLGKQIGEGPFGIVFQAKDQRRGGQAALKLLKQHVVSQSLGKTTFSRLLASIKAYSELDHPNLGKVIRTIQDPEKMAFGLAVELIEGQSLAKMQLTLLANPQAKNLDPQRLARLLSLFEQMSRALAWLHARGVVHGNLKPSNVMLVPGVPEATVKVLDLCWSAIGVARPAAGVESYLSPEQLEGVPPTAHSDQWTAATMLQRTLHASAGALAPQLATALPAALVQALDRATKPTPAHRFPQVADFAHILNTVRLALLDEPTDRSAQAVNKAKGPKSNPSAASMPAASDFAEEPATVKVPISSAIPKAPLPSVGHVESAATDRHMAVTDDVPPMEKTPIAPPKPKKRPSAGAADLDVLEQETLEPGDMFKDVQSEPSLQMGSLTLPPEAHLPPTSPGAYPNRPKMSPLALWGAILLVAAIIVVAGTMQWMKSKSADASTTPPPPADTTAAVDPPKPAPDPNAVVAAAKTKVEEPKKPEVETPPPSKAVTRIPEVAVRADDPPATPEDAKTKRKKGDRSASTKALDAKADAAMARLASLNDPPAPDPAAGGSDKRKFEVACDEGDGNACFELGKAWKSEKRDDKARDAFAQSCTFKNAEGCHRAADLWKGTDPARAKELESKACKLGRSWSCRGETRTSTSS